MGLGVGLAVRVRDSVRFRDRNRRSEAINFGAIQIAHLNLTPCTGIMDERIGLGGPT